MRRALAASLLLAILLSGCPRDENPVDRDGRRIFRIGLMPNLTHAPALVGLQAGIFQEHLGPDVVVTHKIFSAGPSVVEAIFAGDLDVAYIGPNPAINAYVRSKGTAARIVAGSTSGGAALVVQQGIQTVEELVTLTIATPAIANTQDIAMRTWLHDQGYRTRDEGGDVEVLPIAPADAYTLFRREKLAGAWVPEPWVSRLVLEGGGAILVEERTLWPRGTFPTTVVMATTPAMRTRSDLVQAFVDAHREAVERLNSKPAEARAQASRFLQEKANMKLPPEVISRAFDQLHFSLDPLGPEVENLAERARRLGYLSTGVEAAEIVDTRYLELSKSTK